MTGSLFELRDLQVSFPGGERAAVDGVSFSVNAGQCVALVGESGSGKSLTARAALGMLPASAAQRGVILFQGEPVPAQHSAEWNAIRGAEAGLIPQDALGGLDPLRRIEFEVGDALRLHHIVPASDRRARVVSALEEAGMPNAESRLRQRADQLSGGLRQRALIASTLIADPALIVADEPTTALDAAHRDRVLAAIRDRVNAGAGALVISHDLVAVREVADLVLVMRDGRVVEAGSPDEVFAAPTHPFTRELIAATPAGKARGMRLLGKRGPQTPPREIRVADRETGRPNASIVAAPRLELREVTANYVGRAGAAEPAVLQKLSLMVQAGETVGLLGASGSGKTTLLRAALGLHRVTSGSVLIDGIDRAQANRADQRALRRRVALVPQDPLASFARGVTAGAILRDAYRAAGVPRVSRQAHAAAIADEVGLAESLLEQSAATLSGGQRQRLAIARALARGPELLLLDEPVSALDLTVQARVLDLLDELQERHGTAYLFVSHDKDVVQHMSDRVLLLRNGQTAALTDHSVAID